MPFSEKTLHLNIEQGIPCTDLMMMPDECTTNTEPVSCGSYYVLDDEHCYNTKVKKANEPTATTKTTQTSIVRVFWPRKWITYRHSGLLIGKVFSKTDLVVVACKPIDETDVSVNSTHFFSAAGSLNSDNPHGGGMNGSSAGLEVLGSLNCDEDTDVRTSSGFWLTVHYRMPYLHPEFAKNSTFFKLQSIHLVYFDPPNPKEMQYLSLQPLPLMLRREDEENPDDPDHKEYVHQQSLVEKLQEHFPKTKMNTWNCSLNAEMLQVLNGFYDAREQLQSSDTTNTPMLFQKFVSFFASATKQALFKLFLCLFFIARIVNEVLLRIIHYRVHRKLPNLVELMVSAQQVDLRLQQSCFWPVQYIKLWRSKRRKSYRLSDYAEYIRLYNNLWLITNDIIFGITLATYVTDNVNVLTMLLERFIFTITVDKVRSMVLWLVDTPAGLKLNNDICKFLVKLSVWIIDVWSNVLDYCRPGLPYLVFIVGCSGFFGASLTIALVSDVANLLTIHIRMLYIASARIYNWQLRILYSLMQLFRGKKRNVLRDRIDSYEYDLDQLLLGTILFTVLIFFLPTIFVFYASFATAQVTIMVFKALSEAMLAFLNHFPLFATMLRIKDPKRVPGGLSLEIIHSMPENDEYLSTLYVYCKSKSISLGSMFQQYRKLARRLCAYYLSFQVVWGLAVGLPIPPIPASRLYSIQYSMLPLRRVSIRQLWHLFLTANDSDP
ncbi:pig-Q [Schizosaccharomyces japonicus yFS275]|uniref:Pig-Q n=1 Tax=Schizosaccharomyces japonicus (strain yFS275 / FY16936) TaxID=402676 RepID=B6K383_SCHJY|nr:pig-Q [Schizosaccharomyces japonicus yFS275]EEB07940.2 pig-Q [Schizosaccharomyces japonicus yFS275]